MPRHASEVVGARGLELHPERCLERRGGFAAVWVYLLGGTLFFGRQFVMKAYVTLCKAIFFKVLDFKGYVY